MMWYVNDTWFHDLCYLKGDESEEVYTADDDEVVDGDDAIGEIPIDSKDDIFVKPPDIEDPKLDDMMSKRERKFKERQERRRKRKPFDEDREKARRERRM